MSSQLHQNLLAAIAPEVSLVVDGLLGTKVAAPHVPHAAPGFWSRLADLPFGSNAKNMVNLTNQHAKHTADFSTALGKANTEIGNLTRGSMRDATKQWLNTTGGKTLAAGGAAGLMAAPVAYGVGHMQGSEGKQRQRNTAFGAGMATGLAAPGMANAGMARVQQFAANSPIMPRQPAPQFDTYQGG